MIDFASRFQSGATYDDFLARHATADQLARWSAVRQCVSLTDAQRRLLGEFRRTMNVLCLAGAWCGDCADQCPILACFEKQSTRIDLRFIDRDADTELGAELKVCGGARVPVVVFLSEDFHECARFGDRTLNRYRALAGASANAPLDPAATLALTTADWLNEFERVQWMLRLSPRLRKIHGD